MISLNTSTTTASPYASLGQTPAAAASDPSASASETAKQKSQKEVDDFLSFAKMTPAERMRANILASMGLTEDDVKNMSPAQQKALEAKIEQMVQQQLERGTEKGATGQLADITA